MEKIEKLIKLCQKLPIQSFPDVLRNHGFRYEFVGAGLSRQVYKIEDLPIVLKIEGVKNSGCWQSPNEVIAIRLIEKLKKYEFLRTYTPKIYFSKIRDEYGLIVAHYYPLSSTDVPEDLYHQSRDKIQSLFSQFSLCNRHEICGQNIRYTDSKQPIVVDLGYKG